MNISDVDRQPFAISPDKAKRLVPVMQAIADWKPVQIKINGEWKDLLPGCTFLIGGDEDLRVKPDPRHFWIYENKQTHEIVTSVCPDSSLVGDNWEVIHVKEVL